MKRPMIDPCELAKIDKVLFITHLAIGDFTYLQTYFAAFRKKYPHLRIDIWIDEVRRSWKFWQWNNLAKYSLYDWVETSSCFDTIYKETYSPPAMWRSRANAQKEDYPLVISLTSLRRRQYARLARSISPSGHIVGLREHKNYDQVVKVPAPLGPYHITDYKAMLFDELLGLLVPPKERFPFLNIPARYLERAKEYLAERSLGDREIVYINPFAKSHKRCWTVEQALSYIQKIRAFEPWNEMVFFINAMPSNLEEVQGKINTSNLQDVHAFTARDNFFELPALLSLCTLVISAETSIMHLASALRRPVLALMRQKTPEWAPYDKSRSTIIFARGRGCVESIPVEEVVHCAKSFYEQQKRQGHLVLKKPILYATKSQVI